jgi:hypothetical protein
VGLNASARVRNGAVLFAVLLVGIVAWLVSRPADVPRPEGAMPAVSAMRHPASGGASEPSGAGVPSSGLAASVAAVPGNLASAASASAVKFPLPVPIAGSFAEALKKVQKTLQGPATPQEMLEAATFLSACQGADGAVKALFAMRDQQDPVMRRIESSLGESGAKKMIEGQLDMQRDCQVFDAATLARQSELLKGAYEGGVKEAALPYLLWLISEGRQTARPELLDKLKTDARQTAESGDFMALVQFSMLFSTRTFGHSEVQRQAYKEALNRINREMLGAEAAALTQASSDATEKSLARWGAAPPLSPEQQREADALATRVFEAWRKRQANGG